MGVDELPSGANHQSSLGFPRLGFSVVVRQHTRALQTPSLFLIGRKIRKIINN